MIFGIMIGLGTESGLTSRIHLLKFPIEMAVPVLRQLNILGMESQLNSIILHSNDILPGKPLNLRRKPRAEAIQILFCKTRSIISSLKSIRKS